MGLNSLPMYAGFFIGCFDGYDLLNFTYPSVSCIHNIENNFIVWRFTAYSSFVKHSDALGIVLGQFRDEIP